MNWIIFLHFYQPHNQQKDILDAITEESYIKMVKLLKKYKDIKVNININACLSEQLVYKNKNLLKEIGDLAEKGNIEFVASAKHHAFLPMLPEEEIVRQIDLGMKANQKIFGSVYQPKGFFSSELAYAPKVFRSAAKFGFEYLIVDEISIKGKIGKTSWNQKYQIEENSIPKYAIPSNREISHFLRSSYEIDNKKFVERLKKKYAHNNLITANDVEVFGHHYSDRLSLLEEAFNDKSIAFITFNEYLEKTKKVEKVKLYNGTWETLDKDLNSKTKRPYPLWSDPNNKIQKMQWELAWMSISNMANFPKPDKDPDWKWHGARDELDQGLSSCYWWWASCRPWWNPDMICKGADHLIRSIRASDSNKEKKLVAEKLYSKICLKVWQWHWSGEAQKRIDNFEKKTGTGLYWVRTEPVYW